MTLELERVGETLVVRGALGIGSQGNDDAARIQAALAGVTTLDLSRLVYSWNDAIGATLFDFLHVAPPESERAARSVLLNPACEEAWRGLLRMNSLLAAELGGRIRFGPLT